jgi:hypothetical protein
MMKKVARGGGRGFSASEIRWRRERDKKKEILRNAGIALDDQDLLKSETTPEQDEHNDSQNTQTGAGVASAPESAAGTAVEESTSVETGSTAPAATTKPSTDTTAVRVPNTQEPLYIEKRITGNGMRRADVDIASFVKMLASGDFDHSLLDKEFLNSFPVDSRLKGGAPEAFDKIVKPIVVDSTNRFLAGYSSKGSPYMSGDESRKILRVRKDVSPATFGFKPTRVVDALGRPVSESEIASAATASENQQTGDAAVLEPAAAEEHDTDALENDTPPVQHGPEDDETVQSYDDELDSAAIEARKNEQERVERRKKQVARIGRATKYGLGAAAVAALAYLAYRQYKKRRRLKKTAGTEKKAGVGQWVADQIPDNSVPAWVVAQAIKKMYENGALGRAIELLATAKTKEDVDYINRMYPRLAFDVSRYIYDRFGDSEAPHQDNAALASQTYDRFSAAPGEDLAKPIREADVINSRTYSSVVPNRASSNPQPFDPRQGALRMLAAAMRSPYGIPVYGKEMWDSPVYLSPFFSPGNEPMETSHLAGDASMFKDNPEAKFYPSRANIGYAMPALIGEYARNWMPDKDPNFIYDLGDRTALVEGTIASLASRYPSLRNTLSLVANGYAGRQGEYTGPMEYKSDGYSVLLPGDKGYEESDMPTVDRSPWWDYNANALTPAGSNAWHQAVSTVYAPQIPASTFGPGETLRKKLLAKREFGRSGSFALSHIQDFNERQAFFKAIDELDSLNKKDAASRERLENAKVQLAAANERGDIEAANSFRSVIQTVTAELAGSEGRRQELIGSNPLVKEYLDIPRDPNALQITAADIYGNSDAYEKRKDGESYAFKVPIADMVAAGTKTVDDDWSKRIIPIAYNEGLKLFDEVGPYVFQPDTVVGPQALYANPGGLISDSLSAAQDNMKDYAGKWEDVFKIGKDSSNDAFGKAQKKIVGGAGATTKEQE